jgi:hypothetical protein
MLERIRKWWAIHGYRRRLGRLLVQRYGRERFYRPPQVLTTIKEHGLSERYAAHACAMFCSKTAYTDFLANHDRRRDDVAPLAVSEAPIWLGMVGHDWPVHGDAIADVGGSDFSSDISGGSFEGLGIGDAFSDGGGFDGSSGSDGGSGYDGGSGSDGS